MTIQTEEAAAAVVAAGAAVDVGNSNPQTNERIRKHPVFPDGWQTDAIHVYVMEPNRTCRTIRTTTQYGNNQNHVGPHYDRTIRHHRPLTRAELDGMIRRVRQSESGDVIILERRFPESELVRVYNSKNEEIMMYPRRRAAAPDPIDDLMLPNVMIVDRESSSGGRPCCILL
jgi:hypothetical protein